MKNKLTFRILGALASALIAVAVFVPFISVAGHSPSLWESFKITDSLYLPIMIIVFGVIGVIFFALNIKTEFAYTSVGAISFFVIMQTIDILDQGAFKSLGIGYYFLVIGTLVTGIMAFLTNLKTKKKVEVVEEVKKEEETSVTDQIDKLYNEQPTTQSEISPIQPIDNVVQPLPIQPLDVVEPIQPIESIQAVEPVEELPVNPVVQEMSNMSTEVVQEPVVEQPVQETSVSQPVNSVLQEFNVPMIEENQIQQPEVVEPVEELPVNPVVQEMSNMSTEVVQESVVEQPVQEISVSQPVNPVLQEFAQLANPVQQEFGFAPVNTIEQVPVVEQQPELSVSIEQPAQETPLTNVPLSNINEPVNPTVQEFNEPGFIVTPQPNPTELDIFGQPINKS